MSTLNTEANVDQLTGQSAKKLKEQLMRQFNDLHTRQRQLAEIQTVNTNLMNAIRNSLIQLLELIKD